MNAADIVLGIVGLARPAEDRNFTWRQSSVTARSHRVGGDEFNQIRNQRQTVSVVRGQTGITGLAEAATITDGAKGPPAVIVALRAPTRASRVMHRGVQGEIEFDVPFQAIHRGSGSTNSIYGYAIGNVVCNHVPVAGRRFGLRTICPEFCEAADKISTQDNLGSVGQAGNGVGSIALAVVGSKGIVADRPGRNIHSHPIVCRQLAAGISYGDKI